LHQVLRHQAEAERVDISEQTLVRELRCEGCANRYAEAARLETGDQLVTPLVRYRSTGKLPAKLLKSDVFFPSVSRSSRSGEIRG
jgi:hypothetical protein